MPLAIENGMNVTMTDTVFGRMWRDMIRVLDAPSARAATT